ncbi:MAG: hypothetical protein K6G10_07545, partial [Butyrivibrio sp.]|nr:hypothetical protein [Butyrivibrio sp.]
ASIWIIAIAAGEIVEKIDKKAIGNAFACLLIAVCVFIACTGLSKYKYLGSGGRALDQFRDDITEFTEQTNNEYAGKRAYLANDRHRITGGRDHWELEFLFYGEAIADLTCVDGGVEGFLADEDSLMVIDGSLWDEYADVLTGYVFLEQNTFYVLSHERY